MLNPFVMRRRLGGLLATGQTVQYNSELDDGYYKKGVAKSYLVLDTGQYSLTKNVDLIHYTGTAGHISFVNATKLIVDSDAGLAIFKTNDIIVITGSVSNPGPFTVALGNVPGQILTTEALVNETPAGAVSIAKRESKSNNCVQDLNTGLMWLRNPSNTPAKMGLTSNGTMPWTGQLYDIFQYCAAVNAAAVGGYNDWRIANSVELTSLFDASINGKMLAAIFAAYTIFIWSSTTNAANDLKAYRHFTVGNASEDGLKASDAAYCMLVRG